MCKELVEARVEETRLRGGDRASCISRLFLFWVTPIAWLGTKRPLRELELPPPPVHLCDLSAEAERLWAAELASAPTDRPDGKPNIIRGVCYPIAKETLVLGYMLNVFSGFVSTIVRPLLSKFLIDALRADSAISPAGGWALASAAAVTVFVERWTTVQGSLYAGDEGPLRIVTALTHLVAKKTMALQVGVGKEGFETALLGNDLVRASLESCSPMSMSTPMAPVHARYHRLKPLSVRIAGAHPTPPHVSRCAAARWPRSSRCCPLASRCSSSASACCST